MPPSDSGSSTLPGASLVAPRRERRSLRQWLSRFRLRDHRFFPLFNQHMAQVADGLEALQTLLQDLPDAGNRVRRIEELEQAADRSVQQILAAVRRSIWPPYPRISIVQLANETDNILDLTEDAAETLVLFNVTRLTPDALRLGALALEAVRRLQQAVALLPDLDRSAEVLALCTQVADLESEADHVLRAAMSRLFREEPDVRELIKLRAVYEVLEGLTDDAKDVAARLSAMVLGHPGA
jgi:uncharacterized protein Yka (UPF0111/DUF47 family)